VFSNQLPSRGIECLLQHKQYLGLSTHTYATIASLTTTSATTVQKSSFTYRPTTDIPTDDGYYITCKTNDNKQPSFSTTISSDKWFHIDQLNLVITITAPTDKSQPQAGTNMLVSWSSNGMGLLPGDTFIVELVPFYANSYLPLPATVGGSGSFLEPAPVYTVQLTLSSNPSFVVQSDLFMISAASAVCMLTGPNTTTAISFNDLYTFTYSCTGYDSSDTTGRLSLVDKDGSQQPLTLPMDGSGHALTSSDTLKYQMPGTGSAGWALQVAFLHGHDAPQYSYPLTVQQSGDVCTVSGSTATCRDASGLLVASPNHAIELLSLTVTFAGVDCNSPKAALTLVATWRSGKGGATQMATTQASLRDNQDIEQQLFGGGCTSTSCFDVKFRYVEYLNARQRLVFDLLIILPNQQVAPLLLSTITFVNTQPMCSSVVTNIATPIGSASMMTAPPGVTATISVGGALRRHLSSACVLIILLIMH